MIYEANEENIAKAATLIRNGDVVAFPTETVYGLGANAFNPEAVQKIFTIKERPNFNPLIVHLTNVEQIESISSYKENDRLIELLQKVQHFWPGPLSVILPRKENIPTVVTGGLDTVAIRIPSHPIARALIDKSGYPIAAPSANKFTHISPTKAEHVEKSLGKDIFILDGGSTTVGLESTVITLVTNPPQLLRPGFVTFESLKMALGEIEHGAKTSDHPASPGMIKRHYAPNTPLFFLDKIDLNSIPKNSALISFGERELNDITKFSEVIYLSKNGNLEEVCANLFSSLYKLDNKGYEMILIDSCSEDGLGLAIMDRISRAAEN